MTTYSNLTDEELGRLTRGMVGVLQKHYGLDEKFGVEGMTAAMLLVDISVSSGRDDVTMRLGGVTISNGPASDWEVSIRKVETRQ